MRYASLIFAYAIVALLLGLGFLFPERPLTLMGFLIVAAAFTPVVAGFDMVGQGILDSPWIKSTHQLVKPMLGLVVLAAFLATLYTVVNMVDVATSPWW